MGRKREPRKYSLSIKARSLPSSIAKVCCERVYGKSIAPATWSNWRRWAGIGNRAREIDFDQFCFLVAIAEIRRRQFPSAHTSELIYDEVLTISQSIEVQSAASAAIREMDLRGFVWGRHAAIALAGKGLSVARSTLYEKVPGFSLDRIYPIEYLELMCG